MSLELLFKNSSSGNTPLLTAFTFTEDPAMQDKTGPIIGILFPE
jgi:hypothetical protein